MNKRLLRYYLAFIGIGFFSGIITAQDSTKNSLGISLGGSNFHLLDKHATELIFRGTGIAPSAIYNYANLKNTHLIEGSFYYNKLSSSSDNYKTRILGGNFRYCYLRTLFDKTLSNNQISFSAGISLTSFFMKSDYQFYLQTFWAKAIESWYISHSADVSIQLKYKMKESNTFKMTFFLPIISNVSRPAYSASGDYNYEKNDWDVKAFGNTLVIPKNLIFDAHISYQYNLSRKFNLEAKYEFYFAKCRQPDLVQLYMNNLRIGISFNF